MHMYASFSYASLLCMPDMPGQYHLCSVHLHAPPQLGAVLSVGIEHLVLGVCVCVCVCVCVFVCVCVCVCVCVFVRV